MDSLAGKVYTTGLSRGETPAREIKTLGASGFLHPQAERAERRRCPFYRDESVPFTGRDRTMSLDVVRRDDVPASRKMYFKDYDRCLMTEDLPRAHPILGHPATGTTEPIPWALMDKPQLSDVPGSRTASFYPPPGKARPRDLSLTSMDIDGAVPCGIGRNSEGKKRLDCVVDPVDARYQLASSSKVPVEPEKEHFGRHTLDITDIEGAATKTSHLERRDYGDPLKCEAEFQSSRREATISNVLDRTQGRVARLPTPRRACVTPSNRQTNRSVDPQHPRYSVPLPRDSPGTSLHIRWSEERRSMGDEPPALEHTEIGHIDGTTPKALVHDNGEAFWSLENRDIEGARVVPRVAGLPFSMYGPAGRRPQSTCLDNSDIEGAQVGTLTSRGPTSRLPRGGGASSTIKGPTMPAGHQRRGSSAGVSMFGHALKERRVGGQPPSARSSVHGTQQNAQSSVPQSARSSVRSSVEGSRTASTHRSVETPGLSFVATLRPEQASWPAHTTLPFSNDGTFGETQRTEQGTLGATQLGLLAGTLPAERS